MAKFHIGKSGKPAQCSAKKGNCPFGSESDHYSSRQEAQKAIEKDYQKKNNTFESARKNDNDNNDNNGNNGTGGVKVSPKPKPTNPTPSGFNSLPKEQKDIIMKKAFKEFGEAVKQLNTSYTKAENSYQSRLNDYNNAKSENDKYVTKKRLEKSEYDMNKVGQQLAYANIVNKSLKNNIDKNEIDKLQKEYTDYSKKIDSYNQKKAAKESSNGKEYSDKMIEYNYQKPEYKLRETERYLGGASVAKQEAAKNHDAEYYIDSARQEYTLRAQREKDLIESKIEKGNIKPEELQQHYIDMNKYSDKAEKIKNEFYETKTNMPPKFKEDKRTSINKTQKIIEAL